MIDCYVGSKLVGKLPIDSQNKNNYVFDEFEFPSLLSKSRRFYGTAATMAVEINGRTREHNVLVFGIIDGFKAAEASYGITNKIEKDL